jgi:3-phenylpropionate/trans-cinnamate dioxygenase ferredoxin reductase component
VAESLPGRQIDHLLIGGGLAAASCAAALRKGGADGSIMIVGRELDAPYDRPPCSKEYLRGEKPRDQVLLHPPDWYDEQRIEVLTRTTASKLDPQARVVTLSTKEEITFGQALLATGSGVRRLDVEGDQFEGIYYLRTLPNSDTIRREAAGKRVVLIGGSYIGSEVAASLTELGSQCTIIMQESKILSRGFGEQAGQFFQSVLEEHGIKVHGNQNLDRFEGSDGRVTKVVTESGLEVECDAVVIGAGAVPDVTVARAAGLELGKSGGAVVNTRLETAVPGIYAAGDIAEYDSVIHGRSLRVEHWDVALNQGRTVAANMLGADRAHDVVPYFFSDISDWTSLEYIGPAAAWDHEEVRGSFDDGAFTIYYGSQGALVAALTVGRSEDLTAARELLVSGRQVDFSAL